VDGIISDEPHRERIPHHPIRVDDLTVAGPRLRTLPKFSVPLWIQGPPNGSGTERPRGATRRLAVSVVSMRRLLGLTVDNGQNEMLSRCNLPRRRGPYATRGIVALHTQASEALQDDSHPELPLSSVRVATPKVSICGA